MSAIRILLADDHTVVRKGLRLLLESHAGLEVVAARQSKIPPGRAHGAKSPLQQAVMAALDALNLPLTRLLNVLGDRVVVVGRKQE